MKTTSYLYGDNKPMNIPDEVIQNRIALLDKELSAELARHYSVRNVKRTNDLVKAKLFWENINKE
jgi:hypothetical protein